MSTTDATVKTRTSIWAWMGAGGVAMVIAGATAAATMALYARAAADESAAAPQPLPAAVRPLTLQDGYVARERLLGRVEPARETLAGFERGGLVAEVLVQEGDRVVAGQPLARLDVAALRVSRAQVVAGRAALEADLALARSTLQRRSRLTTQGHASEQALDEARFGVASLESRIAETDARIAAIDLDLDKATVRAPFDAVVTRRMADEGAVVAAGAPLTRLQEADRPRARIGAPFAAARRLVVGRSYPLLTPAGAVEAVLVSVSPDMDPVTRTVAALFDLPADAPVAFGDVVRLEAPRRATGRGAWVPLGALQEGLRGMWALTLVQDGPDGPVAVRTAAEVLHVEGGRAFVRGPFADGALAVISGVDRLAPGQRVAPVAPNPAAAGAEG